MSQWARVGVQIQNLEMFKGACAKNGVEFEENKDPLFRWNRSEVYGILRDKTGHGTAYLCKEGGGFRLALDTDPNYSSLTKRLGANGGRLCRMYTADMVTDGIRKRGGTINYTRENSDGSLLIRATVG